jgi:hypothetical protein
MFSFPLRRTLPSPAGPGTKNDPLAATRAAFVPPFARLRDPRARNDNPPAPRETSRQAGNRERATLRGMA